MKHMAIVEQQSVFADRVKRINAGRQYEHEDVIGYRTQTAFNVRHAYQKKNPRRSFGERIMVTMSFTSGVAAVLLGRMAYFHASQIEGLPKAFYSLEGRGMFLASLIIAGILIIVLQLSVKGRMAAMLLGIMAMHYGEATLAVAAPQLWSGLFSSEYAAKIATEAPEFIRKTAHG